MRRVAVTLGGRSYEVAVGRGLLENPGCAGGAARARRGRRVFLLSDRTVWGLYGQRAAEGLVSVGARVAGRFLVEPGERHKDLRSLEAVWDAIVDATAGGAAVAEAPLAVLERVELAGVLGRAWDVIRLWIK